MNANPSVVVSVVSGRRTELILECLRSIYATTPRRVLDVSVVATVNGPDPDLAARIAADARDAGWEGAVHVHENEQSLGFAANHNRVMHAEGAQFFLIANDDVVVRPFAIERLVGFMQAPANGRVGVVSPKLLNPDGSVQPSTYGFPTPARMLLSISGVRGTRPVLWALSVAARLPRYGGGRSRYWDHDRTITVDSLRGAFMLVREEAVADVGVMDEAGLVGGEETEWHKRMAERGWSVVFYPEAEVVHLGSQSVGVDPALELEYVKGWLNYFEKHVSRARVQLLRVCATFVFALRWLAAAFVGRTATRRLAVEGMRLVLPTIRKS
jgi:N-acetylglucosaminyl-diphospho-decaprenol L-rhamnosyltransferase